MIHMELLPAGVRDVNSHWHASQSHIRVNLGLKPQRLVLNINGNWSQISFKSRFKKFI